MKKLAIILAVMVMLSMNAMAWKLDVFGYTLQTHNTQVVDYTSDSSQLEPTATAMPQISTKGQVQVVSPSVNLNEPQFAQEVSYLNSQGEVQLALKELDYRVIGLTNLDDGREYTAFINEDGTIDKIIIGAYQSDVRVSGSLSGIRNAVERGDTNGVLDNVQIPFSVKAKLVWMRLW